METKFQKMKKDFHNLIGKNLVFIKEWIELLDEEEMKSYGEGMITASIMAMLKSLKGKGTLKYLEELMELEKLHLNVFG